MQPDVSAPVIQSITFHGQYAVRHGLRQKRRLGRAEMLGDGADAARVFAPSGGKLGGID